MPRGRHAVPLHRIADDRCQKLSQDVLDLVELSGEEVVSALHPMDLFGLGERVVELCNLGDRAEFITCSLNNQFPLVHIMKRIEALNENGAGQAREAGEADNFIASSSHAVKRKKDRQTAASPTYTSTR